MCVCATAHFFKFGHLIIKFCCNFVLNQPRTKKVIHYSSQKINTMGEGGCPICTLSRVILNHNQLGLPII